VTEAGQTATIPVTVKTATPMNRMPKTMKPFQRDERGFPLGATPLPSPHLRRLRNNMPMFHICFSLMLAASVLPIQSALAGSGSLLNKDQMLLVNGQPRSRPL